MHAVENRSLVGQGSLLQGYLHHTTLLSFGVGESSEMEAKRCGLAVNRPLFISKGKAPLGKSKKELGDERANNRVLPIIKCIPEQQPRGRKETQEHPLPHRNRFPSQFNSQVPSRRLALITAPSFPFCSILVE